MSLFLDLLKGLQTIGKIVAIQFFLISQFLSQNSKMSRISAKLLMMWSKD